MGWEAAAGLNGFIAVAYVAIAVLIGQGLVRTEQFRSNPLAVATATIFLTCAMHHGHHAAHLVSAFGGEASPADLAAVRAVFGEWHTLLIDALGAAVAAAYLGLRSSYRALLHTPSMFDDAVRRAAETQLRELAFTDLLTGIPNRTAYQALADDLSTKDESVTVLFIDLDGFKAVNDRWGHETGDRVLREIAQRLTAAARPAESVFRLGGDELVVVAVGYDAVAGAALRGRVAALVEQPLAVRAGQARVGASIGVASGRGRDGVDGLLRTADEAMFVTKRARAGVPATISV